MRVLSLFLALLCGVGSLHAGDGVIERMMAKIAAMGEYEVAFSASAEDMGVSKGDFVVSGDRYCITVGDQRQFSDGEARYEVNGFDNEVIIDIVVPGSRNLLLNPVGAFNLSEDSFIVNSQKQLEGGDYLVDLTPREGVVDGISSVKLTVGGGNSLPKSLVYDFNGMLLTISIDKIAKAQSVDNSLFEFDRADYPDYEIIDFR